MGGDIEPVPAFDVIPDAERVQCRQRAMHKRGNTLYVVFGFELESHPISFMRAAASDTLSAESVAGLSGNQLVVEGTNVCCPFRRCQSLRTLAQ
jgi:hypothetical protein